MTRFIDALIIIFPLDLNPPYKNLNNFSEIPTNKNSFKAQNDLLYGLELFFFLNINQNQKIDSMSINS